MGNFFLQLDMKKILSCEKEPIIIIWDLWQTQF